MVAWILLVSPSALAQVPADVDAGASDAGQPDAGVSGDCVPGETTDGGALGGAGSCPAPDGTLPEDGRAPVLDWRAIQIDQQLDRLGAPPALAPASPEAEAAPRRASRATSPPPPARPLADGRGLHAGFDLGVEGLGLLVHMVSPTSYGRGDRLAPALAVQIAARVRFAKFVSLGALLGRGPYGVQPASGMGDAGLFSLVAGSVGAHVLIGGKVYFTPALAAGVTWVEVTGNGGVCGSCDGHVFVTLMPFARIDLAATWFSDALATWPSDVRLYVRGGVSALGLLDSRTWDEWNYVRPWRAAAGPHIGVGCSF